MKDTGFRYLSRGTRSYVLLPGKIPIPGGAMEELDVLELTTPEAAIKTVDVHREAFKVAGAEEAFARVIGVVVQPGVEFGNENVIAYDSPKAQALSATLEKFGSIVFEAHSTDYQSRAALRSLVTDGFSILKVGPGLTFALREAYYGLDLISEFLFPGKRSETLAAVMERVLTTEPKNWNKYYHGSETEQRLQRHFSYSDRIRYYWPQPDVARAVKDLFDTLDGVTIPETLISQYLQKSYTLVRKGLVKPNAKALALASVGAVLEDYFEACHA